MKIKTSELIGPALDWAVAKIENLQPLHHFTFEKGQHVVPHPYYEDYDYGFTPSTDWANGGPIIDKMYQNGQLLLALGVENECQATFIIGPHIWTAYGPTPLIAAMRCFVASKLGNEVDIPKELMT